MIFSWVRLQYKEANVVAKYIFFPSRESKLKYLRYIFLSTLQSFMENTVSSTSLGILILMIVVDSHVSIESHLKINYFGLVDVIFIDFFGNNIKSDIVMFFEHDSHLIQNEF
jgi:hypothetical protein